MNIYSITNGQGQVYDKFSVNKKLENCGIPADVIAQGETAIKNYASEHNIKLPKSDKVKNETAQEKMHHGQDTVKNETAQANIQHGKPEGVGEEFDQLA